MTDAFATIRALEERALNAWPALETVLVDGWVLRFADGYTKRANSVNALAPRVCARTLLPLAEALYRRRNQPLVFRLSPLAGPDADAALADEGFAHIDETIVMTATLDLGSAIDPALVIKPIPELTWSTGFAAANRVPEAHHATHDRMLAAIRFPAAFASLERERKSIAWGLAVAERDMVGLFDIATSPDARRQGAGRRLVTSLLAWGESEGATGAYLQVVAANTPAIALYRDLGFAEVYRYHYRVRG